MLKILKRALEIVYNGAFGKYLWELCFTGVRKNYSQGE